MSQEKISGRKRAVEVVLVRTNREKREEEQLQKVRHSATLAPPRTSWRLCCSVVARSTRYRRAFFFLKN